MAFKFLFLNLITAMIAVNLIFADEESGDRLSFFGGGKNNSGGFLGLPFLGGGSGFGGLPNIPNLPNLTNLPFLGSIGSGQLPSFGSRQERSADHQESDEEEPQDRLFFSRIISCNYTTQGGTRCSSCRQVRACYPNNVGRLRTCRGFLRYCNDGRCSFLPGALCSASTATTATDAATTTPAP